MAGIRISNMYVSRLESNLQGCLRLLSRRRSKLLRLSSFPFLRFFAANCTGFILYVISDVMLVNRDAMVLVNDFNRMDDGNDLRMINVVDHVNRASNNWTYWRAIRGVGHDLTSSFSWNGTVYVVSKEPCKYECPLLNKLYSKTKKTTNLRVQSSFHLSFSCYWHDHLDFCLLRKPSISNVVGFLPEGVGLTFSKLCKL
jgi:hypothetical protein